MRPRPGNHVFNRNVVFEVVEFDQGQFFLIIRVLGGSFPGDKAFEALLHFVIEVFFQAIAFQSDFTHRLEIHVAFSIVIDLVREFEHRIIDVLHQYTDQIVESVEGKTSNRVIDGVFTARRVNDFKFGCQHLLPVFLADLP